MANSYYEKLKKEAEKQAQAKEKGKKQYQEVMEELNRENSRKSAGSSTDSVSTMLAPVRSDIGTAGSSLGAPLRSSAGEIAKSILAPVRSDIAPVKGDLGAPLRSDIAPVNLTQQQKQQQGAVQAWASQTGAKVNPWMMANANANYAQDQLTKTEEAYDAFLQANQNSSTPPVNLPEAVKLQEKAAGLDSEVAYWENQKTNHKNQAVMQKDMEEFEQWPEEDKKLMEQYARGKNLMPLDIAATSAQQKLREKYGLETLNRMEESYSWYRNQENTKKVADLGREHATGAAGKTLSSIASVGTNLMSNAAGAMDTLYAFTNDAITGTGRYSGLDPNLRGNLGAVYSGAVRGKVSEDLEKHGTLGKVGSVAYQGTMSGLDSFARLYSAGEAGALVLAGMGSFSQTVSEASAKGASPEQAIGLGVINAGLEVATEKVSLGNLLDQSATGYQGALKAVKDAFVQAGVEVSEEELSFIGSTLAEAAILREKSSYNQQIGELVANGMSYQEAKEQADRALVNEALQTAAVSGFSGGMMSGAASVVNKVTGNAAQPAAKPEAAQNIEPAPVAVRPEMVVDTAQEAQTERAADDIYPVRDDITSVMTNNEMQSEEEMQQRVAREALRDFLGFEEITKSRQPDQNDTDVPGTAAKLPVPVAGEDVNLAGAHPESTVGAAEKGFTGKESYYDLMTDENAQPDRPGDVRPMEVPKTDAYGRRVSETTANAYGAEVTPDAMASRIEELVADGALGFDTRTNKQSLENAAAEIQKRGMYKTEKQITLAVANGKIRDGDIEKAMLLYASYANQNSQSAQDKAAELMVDLATMANMTGRNLQLFKMLRRMTPDGQLMTVQKNVDRYVDQLNTRRGKNNQAEVNIPQEMMDQYREAAQADIQEQSDETARAKEEAEQAIYKIAAAQIKATPMEKLNAWRYMAMLGNVKTQVRNVAGNAAFRPYVATKRAIGAVMEQMFVEQGSRTKSILGFGKNARALRQWAAQDAKSADTEKLFDYSARTGDASRGQIEENRAIYDTKALEATRKFIQAVPEGADMIFKRAEYTTSLASFLKARGYTAADLEAGNVADGVLNEARSYAAQEALKATFNDQNAVSDFVSKRYKGNNAFGKAMNLLAEGVMPFRRTPANILVRAVEYSPANIGRSMYNFATKVRSGEMTASTAIDQMAAGLTGTGAMVLGYAMASGVFGFKLVGHLDDEDEKNAGHQAYALEIGGKSYSLAWAAPANIPLFVGANIYDAMKDRDPDTGWFVNAVDASVNSLEPMLELSCLSSLNDLVESARYAEDGTEIYTVVAQGATSYLNQYIPTLFGQIEQAAEGEKKQVYSNADTALERSMEKTIGRATQKIPGVDLYQTQKFDNWGRPVETSNPFDAFLNPSYSSKISTDPVDAEIQRLNGAQDQNVSIDKPAQTVTYTDTDGTLHKNERLTAQQWETVQQVYGQTAKQILDGVIDSKDYKALSDSQKAEVFSLVYDYAREKSRAAAVEDYAGTGESWMEGIEGKEGAAIIRKVAAAGISGAFDGLVNDWKAGGDGAQAAEKLDEAYGVYSGLSMDAQTKIRNEASGRMEAFLTAKQAGIDTGTFADLYKTYYDINGSNVKAAAKANNWAYELQRAKERGEITNTQMKVLKRELTISSGFTVEAEKFDALTESGLSAEKADYITDLLSRIKPQAGYSDVRNIQKAEKIAGVFSLTESEKVATMKIYLSYAQNENLDEMRDLGYSTKDYVKAWQIYDSESGQGKKQRTIARYQKEFGISYAAAKEMYEIYG